MGPAGTGKTTLARGVAKVAGARRVTASAALLQDVAGLLGLVTRLDEGAMLFLDEIHAVPPSVREVLYEAMTDRVLSLTLHDGLQAKAVRLELPRFTVLAATTAEAKLDEALRSRFRPRIALGPDREREHRISGACACHELAKPAADPAGRGRVAPTALSATPVCPRVGV